MHAFLASLFLIFVAEMGDKTQLVALTFATRFPLGVVLLGIFTATLAVHLFSVFLGQLAGEHFPAFWVNVAAALAFIGFGIWTLRGDSLDDKKKDFQKELGPFLTVAATFFLAELGDKTMLATITIASQEQQFLGVWLGSSLGMVLADGLAIIVGQVFKKTLPERLIKYVAAAIFIASGLFTLYAAWAKA